MMRSLHVILSILALCSFIVSIPTIHDHSNQQTTIQPSEDYAESPIRNALIENKIIGDVLDDFEPACYLDIAYPKSNVQIQLGNEIKTKAVKQRPRIGIHTIPSSGSPLMTSNHKSFTLILTDPDATSRYDPKWSEMCHWIFTNMTATHPGDGWLLGGYELVGGHSISTFFDEDLDVRSVEPDKCRKDGKGKKCIPGELVSYFPPGPPPKTGWHRYVFVLLAGDASNLTAPAERKHWGYGKVRHGVRDWANENGLEVVSANFFFSKNKKQ